jgi:hypothetical protein
VGVARALEGLGLTLAVEQPVRAVQLWSASAALRARLGATPYPAEGARVVHELEQVRVRLGEAAYCAAWTVGQATSIGRIVAGTTPPG